MGRWAQLLIHLQHWTLYAPNADRTVCWQVTLLKLLKAYEEVLLLRGIDAESDTHYYRLLLQLSLDSSPDWWGKLHRHAAQWAR